MAIKIQSRVVVVIGKWLRKIRKQTAMRKVFKKL